MINHQQKLLSVITGLPIPPCFQPSVVFAFRSIKKTHCNPLFTKYSVDNFMKFVFTTVIFPIGKKQENICDTPKRPLTNMSWSVCRIAECSTKLRTIKKEIFLCLCRFLLLLFSTALRPCLSAPRQPATSESIKTPVSQLRDRTFWVNHV